MIGGGGRPSVTEDERPVSDSTDFSLTDEDSFDPDAQAEGNGVLAEGPQAPEEGVFAQILTSALPGEAGPVPSDMADEYTTHRPTHQDRVFWAKTRDDRTPETDLGRCFMTTDAKDTAHDFCRPESSEPKDTSEDKGITGSADEAAYVRRVTPEVSEPSDTPRGIETMNLRELIELHRQFDLQRLEDCTAELVVPSYFSGLRVNMLVDSGTSQSLLSCRSWERLYELNPSLMLISTGWQLRSASGSLLYVQGQVLAEIRLAGQYYTWQFVVADIQESGVLGMEFLRHYNTKSDMGKQVLILGSRELKQTRRSSTGDGKKHRLAAKQRVILPARRITIMETRVQKRFPRDLPDRDVTSPAKKPVAEHEVVAERALGDGRAELIHVPTMNPTDSIVVLPPATELAWMSLAGYVDKYSPTNLADQGPEATHIVQKDKWTKTLSSVSKRVRRPGLSNCSKWGRRQPSCARFGAASSDEHLRSLPEADASVGAPPPH